MKLLRFLLVLAGLLGVVPAARAYSVLTHQAVVDTAWTSVLRPLLERRYPGSTDEELDEARSYAYGGAIIQDMGYYPMGSELITNMMHYARPGDFVRSLLQQAHSRNEFAFALGALAHYAADAVGHAEGTNHVLPDVYGDLKQQFGPVVTYEQAPIRHTELEFAFDVLQVAAGRYHTQDYHRAIGFRVSKPVLERAVRETYGVEIGQLMLNVDVSVATFRFTVNQLMPVAARAAWHSQRKAIRRVDPHARRRDYMARHSRRDFEKEYGTDYQRPGLGARVLAKVINLLPKIGPLRKFTFTLPDKAGEQEFRRSFAASVAEYRRLIKQLPTDTTAQAGPLANLNLDTGKPVAPAAYALADQTYNEWLHKLRKADFEQLTPSVRQHLLRYYQAAATAGPAPAAKEVKPPDAKDREELQEDLQALRALPAISAPK